MKKFLAIVLSMILALGLLAGCSTTEPKAEPTAAPTEAATEAETTEEATEEVTEAETEAPTEAETEAPTEAETEAPTEAETEAPTEAETEAPTEAETEAATEAETEAETLAADKAEPETEAATEAETEAETEAATEAETEAATEAETEPEPVHMTYAEYIAAELDTYLSIDTYVQDKQAWWDNKATIYTQTPDGAIFVHEMVCSEEDYAKLVPGTKICVTGYKTEWSGEVEIASGATFEILEGEEPFIAEALDATELLASEDLVNYQNQFVSFKGMTVEASKDADGNDVAFLFGWDGSGEPDASDLYFNVSVNGNTYNFVVESYLRGADTDVYSAVKALNIGDVIDMEGYLYWYNGVNPHIISVTVVPAE